MTACDDTKIEGLAILSRLVTVLLFLLAQVVAALLIGSVALAVSFGPAQSAEAQPAALLKPGDARSGSLLLKNGDSTYADATRLGIDVDITVSGPTIRARVTQPDAITLPKTATDAELKMIAGSILLALGLVLLVFNRRQQFAR